LVLHHGRWFRQVFLDLNLLAICGGGYTDFTWAEGTATQGCDRSADQRPEWRGGISRPKREETFWRQSGKSQGFGDRSPTKDAAFRLPEHPQCRGPYNSGMGLDIELQDERGETLEAVADPQNLLGRLLPPNDDASQPTLASIDPYGDTVFNRIQIKLFLREWAVVSAKAQTAEELRLVAAIEKMAIRCHDEVHLYLKFIGD
jgi:hypothetical protein